MLATVINALALQDAIERQGQPTRVLSAVQMAEVCEPYIRRRAIRHLEKGRVVIFAAGMGNPYFTTDTSAALRAAEIEADQLLKGTHSGVDGVYSADPKLDPTAKRYERVPYMDVVNRDLRVMDLTAITFCKEVKMPDLGLRPDASREPASCTRWRGDRYADRVTDDDLSQVVIADTRDRMDKAVEHARADFATVRSGRATPGLGGAPPRRRLRGRGGAADHRGPVCSRGEAARDLPVRQDVDTSR